MVDPDSSNTPESSTEEKQEDSDSETPTIEDARFKMRSTKHAEEIVRQLAHEDYQRPSDMLPKVEDRTGISRSNFYNLLGQLEGILVEKVEGPGRATLYTLTDPGAAVAEEFGLTPAEENNEQAGPVIHIAEESAADAIWEIMQHKNITCGDLEDLILPKLRTRERDSVNQAQSADIDSVPEQDINQ
jgi:hypothetical protein